MYISVCGMTLSTAMLVIGGQNIQKDICKESDAPLYLVILGGVMFGVALLKALVEFFEPRTRPFTFTYDTSFAELNRIFEGREESRLTNLANVLINLGCLAQFCITIWGSIKVFGAYAEWNYEDIESLNYCPYTPFLFSFIVLILSCILIGLFLTGIICSLCAELNEYGHNLERRRTNNRTDYESI